MPKIELTAARVEELRESLRVRSLDPLPISDAERPVNDFVRNLVRSWDRAQDGPETMNSPEPVGKDIGARWGDPSITTLGLAQPHVRKVKDEAGVVCSAVRFQRVRHSNDDRAFVEIALWVDGKTTYAALGLDDVEHVVSMARKAAIELRGYSPRWA